MGTRRSARASGADEANATPSLSERRQTRRIAGASSAQSTRSVSVVEVTQDMVGDERGRLLLQKQTEADQIVDRHDDLLREKYHMVNWKSMLGYQPQVAKTDHTQVFQDFKAQHDLFSAEEPSASPSRQTRRAATERKKTVTKAFASISAPPATLGPLKSRTSNKKRQGGMRDVSSVSAHGGGKGKGKEKEVVPVMEEEALQEDPSTDVDLKRQPTPQRRNARRGTTLLPSAPQMGTSASTQPLDDHGGLDGDTIMVRPRRLNGLKRPRVTVADTQSPEAASEPTAEKIKKKPKVDERNVLLPPNDPTPCPIPGRGSISAGRTLQRRPANNPPVASNRQTSFPAAPLFQEADSFATLPPSQVPSSPESPKHAIKRIKLIVRKPMPVYSNPHQRPQPAKFNNSLTNLLSSYAPSSQYDTKNAATQRRATAEAIIRNKEARFRQQGRFIPGSDVFFGTRLDTDVLPPPYQPPKRESKDIWDSVIESVVAHHQMRVGRKVSVGRQVAGQVAARVQTYWDAQAQKKDKARLQEEKRLRGLAKTTVRMVVNEWKRAVHHIREQKRLKEEEEERRRGHEHLDAILDQSGQLLFTQQTALRRGGQGSSRASSVRFAGWGSDSDDETDDDEGSEDGRPTSEIAETDNTRLSEDDDDEDEDDDGQDEPNSTMLLMGQTQDHAPSSPTHRTESPHPHIDDPDMQASASLRDRDDDEDSIAELDHLTVPDPETSPVRPMRDVPFKSSLVDYSDSSDNSRSPSVGPQGDDLASEHSQPQSPQQLDQTASVFYGVSLEPPEELLASPQPDTLTPELLPPDDNVGVERHGSESPPPAEENKLDDQDDRIPEYLKPFAVAPVEWVPSSTITPPLLLRGTLRPYQQSGLEWLASLHANHLNGILADEMGLGKTIQTIALLAHLACDRGIWGPHLIVVPTSVLLNWEMEFKKFLPGFKVLSYHGSTKRRKELRQGWMDKHHFNVCITSYALASKDQHIFKRKPWYYMILDEAHMIKNFKSQRWNILLMFRSFRRLLLTGTPLQNNLTELWALLQFLMSGSSFANLKEFGDWFSNPLEKAIEMGNTYDEETLQRASKLHTVLRPYLLRRLKRDVEKELPSKYEHLLLCPLSKRQRFLYDEFMSRAQTTQDLQSGVYQKIANILMQLRKVCNHPDLFEVRPIVTSFAMQRSAIADFEIKELLIRRRWLEDEEDGLNLDVLNLQFIHRQGIFEYAEKATREWEATTQLPYYNAVLEDPPFKDTRTIAGFRRYAEHQKRAQEIARWSQIAYLNRLRCSRKSIYSHECITKVSEMYKHILPLSKLDRRHGPYCVQNSLVRSYEDWADEMAGFIDRFAFVTPAVVALDMPRIAFPNRNHAEVLSSQPHEFDQILHRPSVKLQIAFPDPSLLQYDCGKLQRLAELLREKKLGGHRVLIFTQMTRILDILEMFLSFHGYLYLRLDGATKIEDRQYITERFNADPRIFCFISSSRSGGVGINLTGADTVVFYDSDFNPQMDRQCEDRAHRIGQIRDVHIYRFVSQHTVEEAMLRKANQKRSLDDLVIQRGEFDWRSLFKDESALTKALGEYDDEEDARAAAIAEKEAFVLEGADEMDFGVDAGGDSFGAACPGVEAGAGPNQDAPEVQPGDLVGDDEEQEEGEQEGGATTDYMISFVERDYDFFRDWRI